MAAPKFNVVKSIKREGNRLTVEVFGSLTIDTANDFTKALEGKLSDVEELVLDMRFMAYVTSAGLRSLVKAIKEMSAHGGKVVCKNVNSDVMGVFELVNIIPMITIE